MAKDGFFIGEGPGVPGLGDGEPPVVVNEYLDRMYAEAQPSGDSEPGRGAYTGNQDGGESSGY